MDEQVLLRPHNWAIKVGVIQGLVWLALCALLCLIELPCERLFIDLKVPLPAISILSVRIANFLFSNWLAAVACVYLWGVLNFALADWLGRPRSVVAKLLWYIPTVVAPVAFLVFAIAALAMQMTTFAISLLQ